METFGRAQKEALVHLQLEMGGEEEENRKMFHEIKKNIATLKERFQRIRSTEEEEDIEEKISEELINRGEERRNERKSSKSKLVATVEADINLREKMLETMNLVSAELENSGEENGTNVFPYRRLLLLEETKKLIINSNSNSETELSSWTQS